ncbi:PrsW family intramembrane metalloprotease [Microbacterium maritypicum]
MSSGGPSQPSPYTPPPAQPPAGQPAHVQPGYAPPQPQQPAVQYPQAPQYGAQQYAQSAYTPAAFSQRPTYASVLAQPTPYSPPAPVAPSPSQGLPALPSGKRGGRIALGVLFGFLGLLLLALIAYFGLFLGALASVIGLVLALIPLTAVFLVVRMIDRWEPEPKSLVFFAIAWGAIAAVGLTLLVDLGLSIVLGGPRNEVAGAVIQAPVVEELWKGVGVFLIFLIARRSFDGPVDGVVYGALVGAGFAFTENIQYFAISLIEGGGEQLTVTFILRAIMSPFAHAMFTSLTGLAIGLAARRGASTGAAIGFGLLGMLGAMFLHGLWNGSSFANFFLLYFVLQVPLFVGFILGVVALRREEARLTKARLGDYAAAGWFTPEEVTMLATPAGRKTGLRWAAQLRGDRRPLMREFIKDATTLAAVRQRAITGRDPMAPAEEQALLVRTRAARAALLAY